MTDEAKEILSVAAAEHEYIRFVQTLAGTTSIGTGGRASSRREQASEP